MQATFAPYNLDLKYPFTISGYSRTSTPLLLLKLRYEGLEGYGEASMVPYLGESYDTAGRFISRMDWSRFRAPFHFPEVIAYLDSISSGNTAIKAAIEIALNDLQGKMEGKPCYQIYNADPARMPNTSYTLGIDTEEVLKEKVKHASSFKVLKVKLGTADDKAIIRVIRSITNVPIYVDANQGWTSRKDAIALIYWLHDQGVTLIEQPMNKDDLDGNAWLTGRSPIPILADEACQRLTDIDALKGAYHGINVKLMKSGGMYEAHQMILRAKAHGMKVLIGCMSETSIATQAGMALAPLCDWADLDGPFLTTNNPLPAPALDDGRYKLEDLPGLGLKGLPLTLLDP